MKTYPCLLACTSLAGCLLIHVEHNHTLHTRSRSKNSLPSRRTALDFHKHSVLQLPSVLILVRRVVDVCQAPELSLVI